MINMKRGTFLKRNTPLKRSRIRFAPMTPRKELDWIVSQVVRRSSADSQGMVKCATCPKVLHWKYMQCGHFQDRAHTATRYDMRNLAPQCEDCNCFNDGENDEFAEFIDGYYGKGTADELRKLANTIVHDYNYEQEIIKWEALLATIVEKNNGIEY